jgi:hypothetical protein
LLQTPEKDTKIKDKLKKIPRKVKEKFISFWRSYEPSGNIQTFKYAKNITVVNVGIIAYKTYPKFNKSSPNEE